VQANLESIYIYKNILSVSTTSYERAVVDAEKKRKRKKAKEKASFGWKERGLFKKSLTEPTLLEMYGKCVSQDLGREDICFKTSAPSCETTTRGGMPYGRGRGAAWM
jgi:hypothetical protein